MNPEEPGPTTVNADPASAAAARALDDSRRFLTPKRAGPANWLVMGRSTTDDELELVLDAKKLWPRIRGHFRDPRLQELQDDLEHSAIERVLKHRDMLSGLPRAERDAALQRVLTLGALDEARKTTGSASTHRRELAENHREQAPDDEYRGAEDANLAAVETLAALNLSSEERVIAGCYALGARNARDIARVIQKEPSYVTERLRTLLPYMRGMLSDRVAPQLDEGTRQLICRYAQGELNTSRRWRERHNAQRLVANNPACTSLWRAQCATDQRLGVLLPLPVLVALY